jgi:hypothetical protein
MGKEHGQREQQQERGVGGGLRPLVGSWEGRCVCLGPAPWIENSTRVVCAAWI